jgi:hypothetical protein
MVANPAKIGLFRDISGHFKRPTNSIFIYLPEPQFRPLKYADRIAIRANEPTPLQRALSTGCRAVIPFTLTQEGNPPYSGA